MLNFRTVKLTSLSLAVASLSLLVAFVFLNGNANSKAVLVAMGDYIEGETAISTIALDFTELDEVYEVRRSCGCIKVRSDGDAPKLPFRIPANGSRKLDIELETLGIVGTYHASVSFLGTRRNRKVEKRFDLVVSAYTGWRVEPAVVRFDDCEEGQLLHASLSIYSHKRAETLQIENTKVSDESRMNLSLVLSEPDKTVFDGDYKLYATAKLGFTFETSRTTDSVEFVGCNGKVKVVVPVLANRKSNGLAIKPKSIFRKRNENAKSIVWIEHSSNQPPTLITVGSDFQVEIEDAVQKDHNRSVTKALISRRSGQGDDVSKTQKLVFESTGSRSELEIVMED